MIFFVWRRYQEVDNVQIGQILHRYFGYMSRELWKPLFLTDKHKHACFFTWNDACLSIPVVYHSINRVRMTFIPLVGSSRLGSSQIRFEQLHLRSCLPVGIHPYIVKLPNLKNQGFGRMPLLQIALMTYRYFCHVRTSSRRSLTQWPWHWRHRVGNNWDEYPINHVESHNYRCTAYTYVGNAPGWRLVSSIIFMFQLLAQALTSVS